MVKLTRKHTEYLPPLPFFPSLPPSLPPYLELLGKREESSSSGKRRASLDRRLDVDEEGDAAGEDRQLGAGVQGPREGGREGGRVG